MGHENGPVAVLATSKGWMPLLKLETPPGSVTGHQPGARLCSGIPVGTNPPRGDGELLLQFTDTSTAVLQAPGQEQGQEGPC